MDERCQSQQTGNPALLKVVIQHILMENGINIHVMMPYADSLQVYGRSILPALNKP